MTLTGNENVQTGFAAISHGALNLQELKNRKPEELLAYGEELGIEGASVLRKQDLMFAILKEMAEQDVPISGQGVLEVLPDGFGFLRSPEANYLPGPDDIYVSPGQIRRFSQDRRHGGGNDPQPPGKRTLLRPRQAQPHQFPGTRDDAPQGAVRQSDTALS